MERNVVIVRNADAADALKVRGEQISVLVDRKQTGGHEIVLHVGTRDAGPPPHFHPWDEDFYVLRGEIEFRYGESVVTLGAGEFIHFPAGVPHSFRHVTGGARALGISSPSDAVEFFTEMDRHEHGPPDFEKMVALAHRYGVEVVGQPR
jgi:quercetin dioxygenase-like cupin family protein